MIATIDKAGRLVIPKAIRDEMGLKPGTSLQIDYVDGKIEIEYAPVRSWVRILDDGLPIIETDRDHELTPITDEMLRETLEAVRDAGIARYL